MSAKEDTQTYCLLREVARRGSFSPVFGLWCCASGRPFKEVHLERLSKISPCFGPLVAEAVFMKFLSELYKPRQIQLQYSVEPLALPVSPLLTLRLYGEL